MSKIGVSREKSQDGSTKISVTAQHAPGANQYMQWDWTGKSVDPKKLRKGYPVELTSYQDRVGPIDSDKMYARANMKGKANIQRPSVGSKEWHVDSQLLGGKVRIFPVKRFLSTKYYLEKL